MQAEATSPRRSVPAPTLASPAGRLVAGLVAAACLVLLGTAAGLTPAPAGHGTHLALGLPACGWVISYSRPCPTCGMTTAFALLANGRPLDAFLAQPFGSLLGTLGAKVLQSRVIWWLVAAAGVSWLYKLSTWTPA
jgi:hypothetical protein